MSLAMLGLAACGGGGAVAGSPASVFEGTWTLTSGTGTTTAGCTLHATASTTGSLAVLDMGQNCKTATVDHGSLTLVDGVLSLAIYYDETVGGQTCTFAELDDFS